MMRNLPSYLIILIVGFAIAACGGRKPVPVDTEILVESVGGLAGSDAPDVSAIGLDSDDSASSSELDGSFDAEVDLSSPRVIYFGYDSSDLTPENKQIVQVHAQYLVSAPGTGIILEGHADERGTREYNLALGEDRAKTVSDFMQALGVDSSRIQTISYGEERPVSLGNDDSAWSLNRRVEILYQ